MSAEVKKEIAHKGGKAAHEAGNAHEWTSKEAAAAGKKGAKVRDAKRKARAAQEDW